jgi:hypothetical protein
MLRTKALILSTIIAAAIISSAPQTAHAGWHGGWAGWHGGWGGWHGGGRLTADVPPNWCPRRSSDIQFMTIFQSFNSLLSPA